MTLCRPYALLLFCAALLVSPGALAREISSYAQVNEDGTLRIDGYRIHLTGIHIPDTGRTCKQYTNPPVCGSRAYIALEFKISGFVRCEILSRNRDRSLVGWCRVKANSFDEGEDLSAYLLERGWAVALPDAPFEYQTLEKIARNRGIGIWGFPVDNVVRP